MAVFAYQRLASLATNVTEISLSTNVTSNSISLAASVTSFSAQTADIIISIQEIKLLQENRHAINVS